MNYSARLALVDDRVGLIVMTCFFTAISIASVGLRLYSRKATSAGIRSDDWFAIAALVWLQTHEMHIFSVDEGGS